MNEKKQNNKNRAFTLIELMVVIAIIAIITAIALVSMAQARVRARDTKRVSDIAQIQLALEQYFDRCGRYPAQLDTALGAGCPGGITLGTFISAIPKTPAGGNYDYYYSNDPNNTDYILGTTFEADNEALRDSLNNITKPRWAINTNVPCDNSADIKQYCIGTR